MLSFNAIVLVPINFSFFFNRSKIHPYYELLYYEKRWGELYKLNHLSCLRSWCLYQSLCYIKPWTLLQLCVTEIRYSLCNAIVLVPSMYRHLANKLAWAAMNHLKHELFCL